MLPERKRPSFLTQVADLLLIELTNWRWSWRSMVTLSVVAPLLSMMGLWVFARDSGQNALVYVLTGNLVLALMFGTLNNVVSHFMFMRMQGSLDYFASLPIRKEALLIAVVLAFFLLALPSLLVTLFVGAWLLDIALSIHPLVLPAVAASTLPLAGLGALIASYAREPAEAGSLSTLITFLLLGLGPVIIPPDRLPVALNVAGRFSPATYAASALRQTLVGPVNGRIWLDLAVLLLTGLLTFWLVGRKLDWRQR